MNFEYKLVPSDYRAAVYFGTAVRYQRPLKILMAVIAVAALYTLLASVGLFPLTMLPAYIAMAYVVWLIFMLGRIEYGILKFVRKDQTVLGRTMSLHVSEETLSLTVVGEKTPVSVPIKQLFCVFETSRMFIIYLNAQQTILLPLTALNDEQRVALRALFGRKLKDQFETRYGAVPTKKKSFFSFKHS